MRSGSDANILAQRRDKEQPIKANSKFIPPIKVPAPKNVAINSLDVITNPTTTANSLCDKIFTNHNVDSLDRKENSNRYYGDLKPHIEHQRSINKQIQKSLSKKKLSIPKLGTINFEEEQKLPKTEENRLGEHLNFTDRMTGSLANLSMQNYDNVLNM